MEAIKECDGCYKGEDCIFLFPQYKGRVDTSTCPCNLCIVKMVCNNINNECEDRFEFYLRHSESVRYTTDYIKEL